MKPHPLTLLLLCLACSGGEADPDGGNTPITQRASLGSYQCVQERGRTDHSPRSWHINPPALATTAKGAFLARIESTGEDPFMRPPPDLVLSSFDVRGTFGPDTKLPVSAAEEVGGLSTAPRGDGFALVWADGTRLRFAAFDAEGHVVVPGQDVLDGLDRLSNPVLAAGPDGGFGLVYAPPVGPASNGVREVRFSVLDAMGTVRMTRTLTTAPGKNFTHPAPTIAATPDGYAMAWRDPASATGGIDFATASATGAELVARRRISAPAAAGVVVGGLAGFEPPTTALIATGGGYLAAWSETNLGMVDSGASAVVRLARLDAAGISQSDAVLRAPTKDIDEVEPTLLPYGDTVAVFWGRGSHIYICGGCVPDNSIELLLIDPTTLTPVSNLLSLTNGGDPRAGGLLRRRVAVLGESLLTTYLLNFHVHATPGSASFRCAKR